MPRCGLEPCNGVHDTENTAVTLAFSMLYYIGVHGRAHLQRVLKSLGNPVATERYLQRPHHGSLQLSPLVIVLVAHGTHGRSTWNRFKIWSSSIVTSSPQRRIGLVDFKVRRVTCASNQPAATFEERTMTRPESRHSQPS